MEVILDYQEGIINQKGLGTFVSGVGIFFSESIDFILSNDNLNIDYINRISSIITIIETIKDGFLKKEYLIDTLNVFRKGVNSCYKYADYYKVNVSNFSEYDKLQIQKIDEIFYKISFFNGGIGGFIDLLGNFWSLVDFGGNNKDKIDTFLEGTKSYFVGEKSFQIDMNAI